jgi:hypothetical protein
MAYNDGDPYRHTTEQTLKWPETNVGRELAIPLLSTFDPANGSYETN